jgi:hypothetical protein
MSKQNSDHLSKSNQLLKALTHLEIAQLIDTILGVLSPELQEQAISQLPTDTQQTVRQILAPLPPQVSTKFTDTETVSLAKQAEIWARLWREWDTIVSEASEEEGKYIVREADWEEPYFDATTFIEDLEKVANKMQPLIQIAFEHEFSPEPDFVTALLDAETDVASGIPDWMEITDGLYLGRSSRGLRQKRRCHFTSTSSRDRFNQKIKNITLLQIKGRYNSEQARHKLAASKRI